MTMPHEAEEMDSHPNFSFIKTAYTAWFYIWKIKGLKMKGGGGVNAVQSAERTDHPLSHTQLDSGGGGDDDDDWTKNDHRWQTPPPLGVNHQGQKYKPEFSRQGRKEGGPEGGWDWEQDWNPKQNWPLPSNRRNQLNPGQKTKAGVGASVKGP